MKRRLCLIIAIIMFGVGIADAAVRSATTVSRANQPITRTNTQPTNKQTVNRSATKRQLSTNYSRQAISSKNSTTSRIGNTSVTSRSTVARATNPINTKTFDSGYNTCHDAYFTCMDQFCANQNDTYRRCVCSSRLQEIQKRERTLSETSDSLQDFKALNIDIISKTPAEVKAMSSATAGEYTSSVTTDKTDSAKALTNISTILSKAKSQSLSTSGKLDIGGSINEIWATTDLTSGANLANLVGEQLYNAVHAQCSEFVSDKCENKSTLNMVVSAYGMYIENDCALISSSLDKKKNEANTAIRETEREMNYARLDNYNIHNSSSINDCIASVRSDITQESACGKDYVHCMDVTGLYLNKTTGEPIYTPNFYQLENQISLSGDILTNQQNRLIVAELNAKRSFAKNSLDSCRDLSDNVWDEFMRQAITEIYQAQHTRIRQVKNECLDVVNKCYDEQNASLKDFSNTNENLLLGSRLELSEEMCSEKLSTCSNLYGGGTQGMAELLNAMHTITDQKIELQCLENLQNYVKNLCAVPTTDTLHRYPYGCRTYAPGTYTDAVNKACNEIIRQQMFEPEIGYTEQPVPTGWASKLHMCSAAKYESCKIGFYHRNNYCFECPPSCTACRWANDSDTEVTCTGCKDPENTPENNCKTQYATDKCSDDYFGSMYQKLVRYALQVCVRASYSDKSNYEVPEPILQDINTVMTSISTDMSTVLGDECERLGGEWITTPFDNNTNNDDIYELFYSETSSNTKWGYCKHSN